MAFLDRRCEGRKMISAQGADSLFYAASKHEIGGRETFEANAPFGAFKVAGQRMGPF
jgi:hypothetical protein